MQKLLIACLIFLSCSAGFCKKNPFVEQYYSIRIQNNSNKWVNFFDIRTYPDTALPLVKPYYGASRPNDYAHIDSKQKWETIISNIPSDTLSIFILSNDTINTYPWDIIRSQYKIIKRYDLSYQDLDNMNWTLTYP